MNSGNGTEKIVRAISTIVLLVLIAPATVRSQTTDKKKPVPAPTATKSTAPPQTKAPAPVHPGGPVTPNTANHPPQPGVKPPVPSNPSGPAPAAANKPAPEVKREQLPGGGTSFTHADGRHWEVGKTGQVTHFSKPGMEARFGDNGKL